MGMGMSGYAFIRCKKTWDVVSRHIVWDCIVSYRIVASSHREGGVRETKGEEKKEEGKEGEEEQMIGEKQWGHRKQAAGKKEKEQA